MRLAKIMVGLLATVLALGVSGCARINYMGPSHVYRQSDGSILLTFDVDLTENTTRILDILRDRGVHAAFFIRGDRIAEHPDVFARIVADGHIVGNHTFHHPQLTQVSLDVGKAEVMQGETALGGHNTLRWFRPPYGELPYDLSNWLESQGYRIIRWSAVDYHKMERGDILLLHETDEVVRDLPDIIATAQRVAGSWSD